LYSEKLYELRQHQQEIQNWLNLVNRKIEDLEDSYLSETNLGNIVRGWDIDGKSQRFYKGPSDEKDPGTIKEKIFSCSSYEVWFENKVQSETEKLEHHAYGSKNSNFKSNKRHRKSLMARKDDPDYGQSGDY
jgi:replicative superfamily II helicase